MSYFASAFREETKKYKDKSYSAESTLPVAYPTTLLPLDYANGMLVKYEDIDSGNEYEYESIGLAEGGIVMLVGKPGTAKSTFAIQVAASITAPFKESVIIYDDNEGGTNLQRIANIADMTMKQVKRKVIHRNVGINAENFFERVNMHCNQKIRGAEMNPEMVTYFTGLYDEEGMPIHKLIPTVYVLDSLALLSSKDLSEEEQLKGQMSTTAQAKNNAQIFRRFTQKLKEANVILIVINHINDKVEINPFAKTQAQINYLGMNETVPGGNTPLYLSNNILKFIASDKLVRGAKNNPYDIDGFIVKVKLIKSRSNRAGQEIKLVFNQNKGFDRILTNYIFLKDAGYILGGGSSFYIKGCDHVKFAQKNFYKKFIESEELREAMRDCILEECREMLPDYTEDEGDVSQHEMYRRLRDIFMDE